MTKESEIIFYQTDDGNVKIEVFYQDETFWMNQKKMSELFGVQRPAITKYLKNIFDSEELIEESVSSILEHTADDSPASGSILNKKSILNIRNSSE
jgi:hypothetical protein